MDHQNNFGPKVMYAALLLLLLGLAMYPGEAAAQTKKARSQKVAKNSPASKPLFRDPIYDGAADPVVVWHQQEKKWLMFYTNRRATDTTAQGVTWVHSTRIGIAQSEDGGRSWTYRDTANINYRPTPDYTHWAPEVIGHQDLYHMYLTYVPGVFSDWNHPRYIIHLTSKDLFNWAYESTLPLVNDKVIDACVLQLPDGRWRLWYNNEKDGKSVYYADSKDLYHWEDKGKALDTHGEGPKVFQWKDYYWMIVDSWNGLSVYRSRDLLQWEAQADRLLEAPGTGPEDGAIGGHPDVVVQGDRAYLFYFIHPGRTPHNPAPDTSVEAKRSLIQLTELGYKDGWLHCDRNKPTYIQLGNRGKIGSR